MSNDVILASISKIHAYRYAKEKQRGIKLGKNQISGSSSTIKLVSKPIPIETDDFSVEFYGTMYGTGSSYASLFNVVNPTVGGEKTFSLYCQSYPDNGIYGVLFSPDTNGNNYGDQVEVVYEQGDDSKFLVTVTRQDTTVKVYINGELKNTKEQSEVKDLGDLQLAIANSSDVGFVRVWNYVLSANEITTLYNNGNPLGYVVPKAKKGNLLAEYLPQNIIGSSTDKTIVTIWLDSAKQLPWSDKYLPPLLQSKGGYDMVANGAPEILFKDPIIVIKDFNNDFNNDFLIK